MFARNFTYNGISLSSFGEDLHVVSFTDVNDDDREILARNVMRSDIRYDQPLTYDYGAVDSSIYSFDMSIAHTGDTQEFLSKSEVRALTGWLMAPVEPQWISFVGCTSEYEDVYFKGRFTRSSYVEQGTNKFGITFHFENIAPYGFTQEFTYNAVSTANDGAGFNITNLGTYVGKTVVPRITINPTATGAITINNTADHSQGAFSINVTSGESITIADYNVVYTNSGEFYDLNNLNNFNWVVLKDGVNPIAVTGACEIEIKARYYEAIGI